MKIKSLFALMLAVCMLFCVTGCGKTVETTSEILIEGDGTTTVIEGQDGYYEGDGTSSGDTSGDAAGTGNTSGGSSKGNSTSGGGLGGATVTLSTWSASLEPATTDPTYADWKKKVNEIEKTYNCKLAFKHVVSFNEYMAAVNSAHAAGLKYADIIHLGSGTAYPREIRLGYYHALDSYVDLSDLGWDQNALKQTKIGGKNYLLFENGVFNGNMVGIAFNRDVLDKFGQKYPSEYVKEGKWNTETFLQLAKACTGKLDGVDYYGFSQGKASVYHWGRIFGGKDVQYKNGKYIYEPDSKYIAGIQFCYDLINTHKVAEIGSSFTDGNVAMAISSCWFADFGDSLPEEDLGWTYCPKGPGQTEYSCVYDSVECWAIPTTVKSNVDIVADIMVDYIYPAKGSDYVADILKPQFFDEESYNTAYAAAKQAQKSTTLIPTYDFILKQIGWNWHGIDQKQSPQAYFDSVKAQAQADLDDVWNQ